MNNHVDAPSSADESPKPHPDTTEKLPQWTSEDLLQGKCEAVIVHGNDVYRLRCTRNNRLILHK